MPRKLQLCAISYILDIYVTVPQSPRKLSHITNDMGLHEQTQQRDTHCDRPTWLLHKHRRQLTKGYWLTAPPPASPTFWLLKILVGRADYNILHNTLVIIAVVVIDKGLAAERSGLSSGKTETVVPKVLGSVSVLDCAPLYFSSAVVTPDFASLSHGFSRFD